MRRVAVGRETLAEDPGPLLRDAADLGAGDVDGRLGQRTGRLIAGSSQSVVESRRA
jgi:hypothetical protein